MNNVRHFTFKHPLFRKAKTPSGIKWDSSIYYLWWEYLRRHDGYRKTCIDGGKGRFAKLYADFGDVHGDGFKDWWTKGDRGATLFAEPAAPQTVERLAIQDVKTLDSSWNDDNVIIIAAPMLMPKRFIQSCIVKLLKKHHPRKRGRRTMRESRARYPIANQFSLYSLKVSLAAYDLKQANPKMKLWEIAQQLRFTTTLNANDDRLDLIAKKNTMGVAVRRKLNIAESVIDGVGKGIFPQYFDL